MAYEYLEDLDSSALDEVGYNADREELKVVYRGGNDYYYQEVPVEVWNALKGAESRGKFVTGNIKGVYESIDPRKMMGPDKLEPLRAFAEKVADTFYEATDGVLEYDPCFDPICDIYDAAVAFIAVADKAIEGAQAR